jgi:hypothetical protein
MKTLLGLLSLLALAGCSVSAPAVVSGADGLMLRGSVRGDMSGGTWAVTDGRLTCSGSYDPFSTAISLELVVRCTDGRRGIATVVRDADLESGKGSVRMEDGMVYAIAFGRYAEGK